MCSAAPRAWAAVRSSPWPRRLLSRLGRWELVWPLVTAGVHLVAEILAFRLIEATATRRGALGRY